MVKLSKGREVQCGVMKAPVRQPPKHEFEANLVYRVISRITMATEKPCLGKTK